MADVTTRPSATTSGQDAGEDEATRPFADPFSGPGELRARCRALDWGATPAGPVERWPAALRAAVRLCLDSGFPMCVFIGPDLVLVYNDGYRRALGATKRRRALGRPAREVWAEIWDAVAPEFAQVLTEGASVWREDRPFVIERDGRSEETFWTYAFSPVRDEGGAVVGVHCVIFETTERVRAAAAVREREAVAAQRLAQLEAIYRDAPVGLAVFDRELRYLRINERLAEMNGIPAAAHVGRTVREIVPALADEVEALARRIIETGKPVVDLPLSGETPAQPGVLRHWVEQWYPLFDATGAVVGMNVVVEEVTERRRAEAALRQSEERLRLALDVAELGTWSWDLTSGTGDIDERGAEIVGLAPGRLEDVVGAQLERVHPDDFAGLHAALAAEIERGGAFDLAYRVVYPDGSVHHVASRARVLANDAGRPVRLVGTNRDVTAEREAEARLRASEARYRTLFESIDEGFCVIEVLFDEQERPVDYRFLEANPAFTLQTGLSNAIGRTIRELAPTHESHWFESYGRVAITGEPTRFEAPAQALGRWYDVNAFRVGEPHERRVAVLFNDITPRKRAEAERERLLAALEVERSHLATVFAQSPSILALVRGPEHVFELANEAYLQLIGRRDVIGRPLLEAVPELRGQGFETLLDGVLATGEPFVGREVSTWVARSPGVPPEERFFDFVYLPRVEADGSRSGVIAHGTDVTEQVRARREVERLLNESERARAEAEAARAEAEAANRAKGEFLAVMSHELRTPLNAIGGYAELMELGLRGPVTDQQRADLARIQQSQRHLLGLINQVLNYTRVDAGAVRYDLEDVPVGEALAAAEALVVPQVRARGLAYVLGSVPPALSVRADRDKLQQILLNLLSNAIKFTEPGGEVRVSCTEQAEFVSISVVDTGIGIAPEKLAHIFEPFVQVDQRLTRPHEGVGLGLAISRDLARGMGGDLVAESTLGMGSVFTLTLPRAGHG